MISPELTFNSFLYAGPLWLSVKHRSHTITGGFIFRFNTLKCTTNAPTVEYLRLKTIRGNKTPFLTPKRYHVHYRPGCCIFISPLGVWKFGKTRSFMFDRYTVPNHN